MHWKERAHLVGLVAAHMPTKGGQNPAHANNPEIPCMNERGSGPPMPLPCEFCPRDQVRNAGPFVQFLTSMSVSPNCSVSTLYCTSSWPPGATMLLWPLGRRAEIRSAEPRQFSKVGLS